MELKDHVRRLLEFSLDSIALAIRQDIERAKNGDTSKVLYCIMEVVEDLKDDTDAHPDLKAFIGHVLGECPPSVGAELARQITDKYPDLLDVLL